MATTAATYDYRQDTRGGNLDVDWLLHSKRDFGKQPKVNDTRSTSPPQDQVTPGAESLPPETPPATRESDLDASKPISKPTPVYTPSRNGLSPTPPQPSGHQVQATRTTQDDSRKSGKKDKKDGRRSSWFSSIGHKIAGGSSHSNRSGSVDPMSPKQATQSPKSEFTNPFDKSFAQSNTQSAQQPPKPEVLTHHVPQGARRPSVLVAAGTETKFDQPSFLTSALRRLSSSGGASLGKAAGSSNNVAPRKVLNVDQNRERTKITEFEQNKLRRVAFCVDVEIAGIASQADEEGYGPSNQNTAMAAKENENPANRRSSISAKYKEKGEGAALKAPVNAREEKEELGKPKEDIEAEKQQQRNEALERKSDEVAPGPDVDPAAEKTTTRKKEKKKRSEAERKERRERKRRHAQMNGLIPLELTREDDDSDDSSENPTGTNTPRNGDKPTTNPLRIYKRCCQLRETTALSLVKEQISKPAATLAESPGTVGVIDLSGSKMTLQDIVTFGDFLAVVPVRKLIMDDCGLGDEAVRVILSGLLGCKTSEQARHNRKLPRRGSGKKGQEQLGVIERLSLKNNSAITSLGWKHIGLFIHLSHSLYALDLTGIPYPKSAGDLSRATTESSQGPPTPGAPKMPTEVGTLVSRALAERYGDRLEELILSGCSLSTANVSELADAAVKCKIRRLGLAGNDLGNEAMSHVVRYAVSDVCEGLDLGSNDLHENHHLISQVIHENNPMFALSLADCNLTPEDLTKILPKLCEMKNFKFIDLSRNKGLFEGDSNAVQVLRKYLPKMKALKRIHLVDVGLTTDQIIALSDVFPDCPSLAHVNILENAPIVQKMNSASIDAQEEAAAFLASLMTAARVSRTLVAVELEVPGSESSEVVKALSQQIVAYSLRNMESSALGDFGVDSRAMPDKDAPDVLLHLVGHMDGYATNMDNDDPAPDEDYLIASTGVVRALGVCLGNKESSRNASRNMTPTASGPGTPRQGPLRPQQQRKKRPKDVSLELCESARKIRVRLQSALVKEDRAGNKEAYRRLWFLDQTLQGMIQRFEDEYPDARAADPPELDLSPPGSPGFSRVTSNAQDPSQRGGDYIGGNYDSGINLKPSSSSTSLAAKALSNEEGRMLKFGASMKRGLLKPIGTDDYAHGTSVNDTPEPAHVTALRNKLTGLSGEEIRQKVESEGADNVVRELEINAEELRMMAIEDPVGFEALRNCSLMNEVRKMDQQTPSSIDDGTVPRIPGTFNQEVTT